MESVKIKVVVIGNRQVGKTSFLNACISELTEYKTPFETLSTLLVEVSDNDQKFIFELYDTKSVDYYKIIEDTRHDKFCVIIVCFSIMNRDSYKDVTRKWIPIVRKISPSSHIILNAMQIDLRLDRASLLRLEGLNLKQISPQKGYLLSKNISATYHESSATSQIGTSDVLYKIIKLYKNPPKMTSKMCTVL